MSAPVRPTVPAASASRFDIVGQRHVAGVDLEDRQPVPLWLGRSTVIWRSKRPGRNSAGSSTSGRFVAASTMTDFGLAEAVHFAENLIERLLASSQLSGIPSSRRSLLVDVLWGNPAPTTRPLGRHGASEEDSRDPGQPPGCRGGMTQQYLRHSKRMVRACWWRGVWVALFAACFLGVEISGCSSSWCRRIACDDRAP